MFLLLNQRRCQNAENNVEAFTPSRCSNSQIWDISLHQYVFNLLSHKDEQHHTLTSSCRDYLTAARELVSLPLICIQSGTEIKFMHGTIVHV